MNFLKILIALSFLSISHADECNINFSSFIYRYKNAKNVDLIKNSTCNDEIKNEILTYISNVEGKVLTPILSKQLSEKYSIDIFINPEIINVIDLKNEITKYLNINENEKIFNLKSLNNSSSVQSDSDEINFSCENCNFPGQHNLKIEINQQSFWFNFEIKKEYLVWIATQDIAPFSDNLNPNNFIQKTIYDIGNKNFFQNLTTLKFYKTNKQIKADQPLLISQLSPISLVRPGKKVSLIIKGKSLSIKNHAISKQSGNYGDYIELQNINSNKKFMAKVSDFNTAEIEL